MSREMQDVTHTQLLLKAAAKNYAYGGIAGGIAGETHSRTYRPYFLNARRAISIMLVYYRRPRITAAQGSISRRAHQKHARRDILAPSSTIDDIRER